MLDTIIMTSQAPSRSPLIFILYLSSSCESQLDYKRSIPLSNEDNIVKQGFDIVKCFVSRSALKAPIVSFAAITNRGSLKMLQNNARITFRTKVNK